jgi:hypothetical protein
MHSMVWVLSQPQTTHPQPGIDEQTAAHPIHLHTAYEAMPCYLRALHVSDGVAQYGALVVLCREPVNTLHTQEVNIQQAEQVSNAPEHMP